MRCKLVLGIAFMALSLNTISQNCAINGVVRYDNEDSTPMVDSTRVYLMQGNSVMYQTFVDSTGHYNFSRMSAGEYLIKAQTTKKNGGINFYDAQICLNCFSGQCPPYMTGIKLLAMDVNEDGVVNVMDALLIAKYSVGQIPNFLPPFVPSANNNFWISDKFTIRIKANTKYTQDLKMICTGDANGSFVPY